MRRAETPKYINPKENGHIYNRFKNRREQAESERKAGKEREKMGGERRAHQQYVKENNYD